MKKIKDMPQSHYAKIRLMQYRKLPGKPVPGRKLF